MCALLSQKRKMMAKVRVLVQELPRWMKNRQTS
jgi:hypothetical protein